MKKLFTVFFIISVILLSTLPASAIDSVALLDNPARYRVIGTQDGCIMYADMESVQAVETMDYPSSLETIYCVLYAETYAEDIDAKAFQENRLVSRIDEYDAAFRADKRNGKFTIDAVLTNTYLPDGQAGEITTSTVRFKNAEELFINIRRAALTSKS